MKHGRWLAAGLLVAVLILGALVALSDLGELRRHVAHARLSDVVAAAVAAVVSFAATGGMQHALLARLGHRPPFGLVVRAVIVSMAANRSLRSGGLSGFASLAWILSRVGIPASSLLSTTIGAWFLSNGSFVSLFALAVAAAALSLASGASAFTPTHVAVGVVGTALLATAFAAAWTFAHSLRARGFVIAGAARVADRAGRITRRADWGEAARGLLERAAATPSLAGHGVPTRALAWTALRVGASVAALWLCLHAVGIEVGPAVLVFAYTAGKAAAVLSFVPAGLGVVEGSIAGVLTSLGVSYEAALAAVLLHRAAYHLVPALVALALAGPLLRDRAKG